MNDAQRLTHGSLFSGIGGFDYAALMMGWRNVFHCEINGFCSRILKYHFPDARHYEDITNTDFTEWRGRIDVLSGGFPCQPFSLAGRRKGAEDDRYLWPHMLRAIHEIRPVWVVGENVTGILTMVQPGTKVKVGSEASLFGEGDAHRTSLRQEYVIETVCRDLEREGYSVQPFVIPACAVGAPHRRDRVWIVATDTDSDRQWERTYQQITVAGCQEASYDSVGREDGTSSNSFVTGCKGWGESDRNGQDTRFRGDILGTAGGSGGKRTAADTVRIGRQEGNHDNGEPEKEGQAKCGEQQSRGTDCPQDLWRGFPTQSPVRGRDDGFPGDLDGITLSKWRNESIKAYGNAVVPQVAYEIFRAIEETYK